MDFEIIKPAEYELKEAKRYYNKQRKGLGNEFLKDVRKTISHIIEFSESSALISPRVRRCLMPRFPYGILYQIRHHKIMIVAVMHLSRKPDCWKSRIY